MKGYLDSLMEMNDSSIKNDSANTDDHVIPAMKTQVKWVYVTWSNSFHVAKSAPKNNFGRAYHRKHSTKTNVWKMRNVVFLLVSTALQIMLHNNCSNRPFLYTLALPLPNSTNESRGGVWTLYVFAISLYLLPTIYPAGPHSVTVYHDKSILQSFKCLYSVFMNRLNTCWYKPAFTI